MPTAVRILDAFEVSPAEILKRSDAARDAVASAAIEGVKLDDGTRTLLGLYASGAIDEDEMMDRGLGMFGTGA